jgi:Phage integrase family.
MPNPRPYARHILLRGSVYYFRIAIPLDLRGCLGLSEVRLSLRTGYAREAAVIARMLAAKGQALFNLIRSRKMAGIDKRELNQMVKRYFHQHLDEYEDHVIENGPDTPDRRESSLEELAAIRKNVQECLSLHQYDRVKLDALGFVTDNGLEIAEGTPEFRRIAHELLKANIDMLSILYHRQQGDYSKEGALMEKYSLDSLVVAPTSQPDPVEDQGLRLFELIDKYCEFKINTGAWTGRGVDENPKNYDKIKFILGDMPLKDITVETAMFTLDCLRKLPKKITAKKYQGLTLEQLISMDHKSPMASKTINSRMEEAASLMKQAITWGYADRNCFDGVKIKDVVSDEDRRLPFSTEDIQSIFNPKSFFLFCKGRPAYYWVPVIALYTGARLEEIAQLWVEDVYDLEGVLVLDINDNGDKRLKNKNARRKIPLVGLLRHDLGFEEFVAAQKAKGEVRIFNELPYIQKRYGHQISKHFGEYLTQIMMGPKKSFHSFRHGFIDFLRNKDIRDDHIASMTGHGDTKSRIPKNYRQKHWIHFVVEKVADHVEFDVVIPRPQ